ISYLPNLTLRNLRQVIVFPSEDGLYRTSFGSPLYPQLLNPHFLFCFRGHRLAPITVFASNVHATGRLGHLANRVCPVSEAPLPAAPNILVGEPMTGVLQIRYPIHL